MSYNLYLDDLRDPPNDREYTVARSTDEAKEVVKRFGSPAFISFDHDLGEDDTSMVFLKWFVNVYQSNTIPEYQVHSANPVGAKNIVSYMESWKQSLDL